MITKFKGAKIVEQGVAFAIVVVQPEVVNDRDKAEANRTISIFQRKVFPGIPVILMTDDVGVSRYYGREDVVRFLAGVPVTSIPWQEFTFTESEPSPAGSTKPLAEGAEGIRTRKRSEAESRTAAKMR